MVEPVRKTRSQRAEALEAWAERVESADLKEVDTEALRVIAALAEERDHLDEQLVDAVRSARRGALIGVGQRSGRCSACPSRRRNASTARRCLRSPPKGCRFANGLQMAASGNERQRTASSVGAGRQLPLDAAPCRLLPFAAGSGR